MTPINTLKERLSEIESYAVEGSDFVAIEKLRTQYIAAIQLLEFYLDKPSEKRFKPVIPDEDKILIRMAKEFMSTKQICEVFKYSHTTVRKL